MTTYSLEEAKDVWVISDTHFNHANIIKYCNRPFSSVEEMNEVLITSWNIMVSENDTVYHLGDFAMGDKSLVPDFIKRLNGNIKFILGNHDNVNVMNAITKPTWEEVIKVGKKLVIMNHYPFSSLPDPSSNKPVIQLHGHVHSTPDNPWPGLPNQYDVGVDNNNFRPISLFEALQKVHQQIHNAINNS